MSQQISNLVRLTTSRPDHIINYCTDFLLRPRQLSVQAARIYGFDSILPGTCSLNPGTRPVVSGLSDLILLLPDFRCFGIGRCFDDDFADFARRNISDVRTFMQVFQSILMCGLREIGRLFVAFQHAPTINT